MSGTPFSFSSHPLISHRAVLICFSHSSISFSTLPNLFSDFSNYYGDESESLLYSLTNTLDAKYIDIEGGIYYYQ